MKLEVISIVHFGNQARVKYLDRSFSSFYKFNKSFDIRHIVVDGTDTLGSQKAHYERFGVELYHQPEETYANRLKFAVNLLKEKYWICLPDDFHWIFPFPLETAITQAQQNGIEEVKLTCRGQEWYSQKNPKPVSWFNDNTVISGESLSPIDDLFVSDRWIFRDFHEQFSIACNILNTEFSRWVINKIPRFCKTGAEVEKWSYLILLLRKYRVAYFQMKIPAFHFIDLDVEGKTDGTILRDRTQLIPENYPIYNELYNNWRSNG